MISTMLRGVLPWALIGLVADRVFGLELNVDDAGSIKSAAESVAGEMMGYYTGYKPGDNPGNLPEPYYWWEAGSMFSHMVDYWYCTFRSWRVAHSQGGLPLTCRLRQIRATRSIMRRLYKPLPGRPGKMALSCQRIRRRTRATMIR